MRQAAQRGGQKVEPKGDRGGGESGGEVRLALWLLKGWGPFSVSGSVGICPGSPRRLSQSRAR